MRTCQNSAQACSLAAELQEAGVHICGLQEVRRKGCKRENLPNGWAFLWSGPTSPTAKRERGVGALLSPTAAKSLVGFYPWPGMEDRIMAMIFSGPVMTTVLVTYAPTNTATQAIKDTYYAQLSLAEKTHAPPSNMLIILADMNAKVGQDVEAWPGIIGGFGGLSTTRPPSPPPLPSPPSPPPLPSLPPPTLPPLPPSSPPSSTPPPLPSHTHPPPPTSPHTSALRPGRVRRPMMSATHCSMLGHKGPVGSSAIWLQGAANSDFLPKWGVNRLQGP